MRVIAQPAFNLSEQNPYTRLLYSHMSAEVCDWSYRRCLETDYDIAHFHWPEWELNACGDETEAAKRLKSKLLAIDLLRARGTRVVWTIHNLSSHERYYPALERQFWADFTKKVDGYIALSASGRSTARDCFPCLQDIPGFIIQHGHYRDAYPVSCDDPRKALSIPQDAAVLLFFGQVRQYKNIPALLRAFSQIRAGTILCIAGMPRSLELAEEVRRGAAGDPRIRLHLHRIAHGDVHLFFRSADLVVLPYREILNSGAALLSLSFSRPVLVPDRGAMGDLQAMAGSDWVRTYPGDIDAAKLEDSLVWATRRSYRGQPALSNLDWPELATQTLAAYQQIRSQGPR